MEGEGARESKTIRIMAYRDAVGIFLADSFGFRLALLKGVLVLELGPHGDNCRDKR